MSFIQDLLDRNKEQTEQPEPNVAGFLQNYGLAPETISTVTKAPQDTVSNTTVDSFFKKYNVELPSKKRDRDVDLRQQPEGFFDAAAEGYGSVGLFIEPDVPFLELEGARRKAGRFIGGGTALVSQHLILNYLTGGMATYGTAALSVAKSGKAAKQSAAVLKTSGELWKAGNKSLALAQSGIGQTYGARFGFKQLQNYRLNKFFNLAADDPYAAVNYLKRGTTVKEASMFVGYGQIATTSQQLQSDEPFDITKNLKAIPFDALGGAIYNRLGFRSLQQTNIYNRVGTRSLGGFGAGFFSTGLNSADATLQERLASGLMFGAIGSLVNGATIQTTRNTLSNSLREFGQITDEALINQYSKAALVKAEDIFKNLSFKYSGTSYYSKSGNSAKLNQISYNKEKDAFELFYDTFNKSGKQTNVNKKGQVTPKKGTIEDFFGRYSDLPDEVIRIRGNTKPNGKNKTFFKTDKDVATFIENKKWGIVSAVNGPFKNVLPVKPGQNVEDALIQELLSRGYKESDIMKISTDSSMKNVFNSFIVKNITDRDAIDIARLTGQQYVKTNKGLIELQRSKVKGKEFALERVLYHSRIPGTAVVEEALERGTVLKSRSRKIAPGVRIRSKSRRPAKGEPKFTVKNPAKFEDIDIEMVKLENGRVVAFGSKYSINKKATTKNARYSSELKDELDFLKILGASRLKNADDTKLGLSNAIRKQETALDMRNADGNGAHRDLKLLLFGKTKTTQLTNDEATTYLSLLKGMDVDETFISKWVSGIKGIDELVGQEMVGLSLLNTLKLGPLYRKYQVLYEKTGYAGFEKFASSMVRKEFFADTIKSMIYELRISQEAIRKKVSGAGLFGLPRKDFDNIMFGLIDPKFAYRLQGYSKKTILQVQEAANEHLRIMEKIDKLAIEFKVPVQRHNPITGRIEPGKWLSEKNYIPLTVSSDFFKLVDRNLVFKQRVLEDLRVKYPGLKDDEYEVLFKRLGKNTDRNGIYGAQYSRTFDLDPVYFIDENGQIIRTSSKDFNKQVGDSIEGTKIAKRVETYDMRYDRSMDRYAGRIANVISLARYFGADTEFRLFGEPDRILSGFSQYGKFFNDMLNEVDAFYDSNKVKFPGIDKQDLKNMIKKDADFLVRSDANNLISEYVTYGVNFTATAGLSGLMSPLRNLVLGNIQTFGTFSSLRFFQVLGQVLGDKAFRKLYIGYTRKAGGYSGGRKQLDTTFGDNIASRGLTVGMTGAEYGNRTLAVPVGRLTAEDALQTLLNPKSNPQKKTKAAALLRDTFNMGDDYVEAVKRGHFTEEELLNIMIRSHGTTQGTIGKPFILPLMDNQYLKPFTLFTRIAAIVTDNVANNIIKPAREGNPAPLLKYVVATGLGGGATFELSHWLYNQPKDYFSNLPETFFNYLSYGEFLAGFGILYDMANSLGDPNRNPFDTFAVTRTGWALAMTVLMGAQKAEMYMFDNEDIGSQVKNDMKTYDLIQQAVKVSALSSNAYNLAQKIKRPNYLEYKKSLQMQRDFTERYGLPMPPVMVTRGDQKEEILPSQHKQYLKVLFYSEATPQEFTNAVRATIASETEKDLYNGGNNMRGAQVYLQNYKDIMSYLENDMTPITLNKTPSKLKKQTDYQLFERELKLRDPEAWNRFESLVKFHKSQLSYYLRSDEFRKGIQEDMQFYRNQR